MRNTKLAILQKSKDLTDEEFFSNTKLLEGHFEKIVSATTLLIKTKYDLHLLYDPHPKSTTSAYCTKEKGLIVANTGFVLFNSFQTRKQKFSALTGLIGHELGHALYTNFNNRKEYVLAIEKGIFLPSPPSSPEFDGDVVEEISKNCQLSKSFAQTISNISAHLDNALEDAYIEYAMCSQFKGSFYTGINTLNSALLSSIKTVEEKIAVAEKEEIPIDILGVFFSAVLRYAKFNDFDETSKLLDNKIVDMLHKACNVIDSARFQPNHQYANSCLLVLIYPYINEKLIDLLQEKKESNDKSGDSSEDTESGDSSENISEEEMDEVLSELLDMLGSIAKENGLNQENENEGENELSCPTEDSDISEPLSDILKNSEEKALEALERQAATNSCEKENALDVIKSASNCQFRDSYRYKLKVYRNIIVTERMKTRYDDLLSIVKSSATAVERRLNSIIKEKKSTGKQSGLPIGRRLETNRLFYNDGKVFSKNRMPEEIASLAVAVLVDESGSMYEDSRYYYATLSALVVDEFCRNLDIPHIICGHDEDGFNINIYNYVDFNSVDGNDKYRLTEISYRKSNMDGLAIQYVAEQLALRPENKKLLIVISDGLPCYEDSDFMKDLDFVRKKYRKDNLTLIAAAIGDDKDNIKELYGTDNIICIDNLEKLPHSMISVIQKELGL